MRVVKPIPAPEGLNAEWYGYCAQEQLRFQRCTSCGRWRHPPRFLCVSCGSDAWAWELSSGTGTIFTWTVTHQAIHPAYAEDVPYAVVVVETDEGVRVVGGMCDLDPTMLSLGLDVRVRWDRRSETITLPVWQPAPTR